MSTIQTIIAGVASIDADEPTLRQALALAERTGATLHLVHAFDLPSPVLNAYSGAGFYDPLVRYEAQLHQSLERVVRQLTSSERVFVEVVPGSPAAAIGRVARELSAELIVVGATRRGALARTLLGTTAQRVLHRAPAPVLVLRRPLSERPPRVLLTTDLTESSQATHEVGLELADALFAGATPEVRSLLVVWYDVVVPPPLRPEALEAAVLTELKRFLSQRRPRAYAVEPVLRTGDPAREIAAAAAEWEADLLVLGTHGRTGASRLLLGSVAEAALRAARCNVLVVPPDRTAGGHAARRLAGAGADR